MNLIQNGKNYKICHIIAGPCMGKSSLVNNENILIPLSLLFDERRTINLAISKTHDILFIEVDYFPYGYTQCAKFKLIKEMINDSLSSANNLNKLALRGIVKMVRNDSWHICLLSHHRLDDLKGVACLCITSRDMKERARRYQLRDQKKASRSFINFMQKAEESLYGLKGEENVYELEIGSSFLSDIFEEHVLPFIRSKSTIFKVKD